MKRLLPRIAALVLGLLLVFGAVVAQGDSLPIPLEKKVTIGQSTIYYAGQTIEITTTVPLLVRLEPVTMTRIQYRIRVQPGYPLPSGPEGSAGNNLLIRWVNFGEDIYEGGVPSGVIEGILDTEGGFVDR